MKDDKSGRFFPNLGRRIDDSLGKAAHWTQQRRAKSRSGLPAITPGQASDPGVWLGVAGAMAKGGMANIPGAEAAMGVLRALYQLEDAQAAMLAAIQRDVRLIREGPFRSGQLLLQEAGRLRTGDSRYEEFLRDAVTRFYDAHGLAVSLQERSVVEFHLGILWYLLGKTDDSRHWLEQSYGDARHVVSELAVQAGEVKVLHKESTVAALTYFYPAGMFVLPAKLKKVWNAQRAVTALQAFLPFVRTIASCANLLPSGTVLPGLQLVPLPDGKYNLEDVPV
jgi:hypothetical protein